MYHLRIEDMASFINKDKGKGKSIKIISHLDKCLRCAKELKILASFNIALNLVQFRNKEKQYKNFMQGCIASESMIHYVSGELRKEDEDILMPHIEECVFCREELDFVRHSHEIMSSSFPSEAVTIVNTPFEILRSLKLIVIAEKKIEEAAKKIIFEKKPFFERLRSFFLFKQLILVPIPIGFSEEEKLTPEFYKGLSEEDLAFACKRREDSAWVEVEKRFRGLVCGIVRGWGLDQYKEDIWQDVLMSLFLKIDDFKSGSFKSYICKFVVNKCRETYRKVKKYGNILDHSRHIDIGDDDVPEDQAIINRIGINRYKELFCQDSSIEEMIKAETVDQITKIIEELPDNFKLVIQDRFIKGKSINEISKDLGVPLNTVLTRISRGKIKIIQIMKKHYPHFWLELEDLKWLK